MTIRRIAFYAVIALLVSSGVWIRLATTGFWGQRQGSGQITPVPRDGLAISEKQRRQADAKRGLFAKGSVERSEKQILFGDLHVHTTYSFDAYNTSLPMYQGEGSHPPGDACDFARHCSGLDFWSINDHAEGLTQTQWSQTREMVRQCNAVAGDPANPDMVTFLGWEWTQIGDTPQDHCGHKNIILRDTAEGDVPIRPISSREQLFPGGTDPYGLMMRLLLIAGATDSDSRQRYFDFVRFLQDRDELQPCEQDRPVRELPDNCQESAPTPTELFAKLDD